MNRKKFFDILPPKRFPERKLKKTKHSSVLTFKKFLIFAFLFLVFLGAIGYFVLAEVEIAIWPKTEILDFEEEIIADTKTFKVSVFEKSIPARIFEIEETASQEFSSSGKIEKKAEGIIRVYNNYHLLVNLKLGTRFQPPSEEVLYFCSFDKIVIPAKSYIDVEVQACRPGDGEKYNIGPSKFSVPGLRGTDLFFYIYGESFEPIKGGGKIPQVTKDDLERGKNILTEQLFIEVKESFKNALQLETLRLDGNSTNFILLENAIQNEVLEIISEVEAGAEVSSFNLRVGVKSKSLVFKKSDLENFAQEFILAQISRDKKLQIESLKFEFQSESIDLESGKIALNLKFSSQIYSDIDSIFLRESLKGESLEESKVILENQVEIMRAQITTRPFWLQKIPKNINKIKLEIKLDTSLEAR